MRYQKANQERVSLSLLLFGSKTIDVEGSYSFFETGSQMSNANPVKQAQWICGVSCAAQ